MVVTVVNAGFSRGTGRRKHRENRIVQGVEVPLSAYYMGTPEFRAHVVRYAPPGEGWQLQGYYVVKK